MGRKYDLIVLPGPHEAQAALALVQLAITRADVALDAAIFQRVPIAPRCTADGLIHVARGLSFENAFEMVISRKRDKCQRTQELPERVPLRWLACSTLGIQFACKRKL